MIESSLFLWEGGGDYCCWVGEGGGVMYLTVCVHGHVVHSEVVFLQAAVSSDVQMMEHSFGCVVVVMVI